MLIDIKTRKALRATRIIIEYINEEGSFCDNTTWVDSKGYSLETDIGYFFEGIIGFADMLERRLKGFMPKYPKACEKYKRGNTNR